MPRKIQLTLNQMEAGQTGTVVQVLVAQDSLGAAAGASCGIGVQVSLDDALRLWVSGQE